MGSPSEDKQWASKYLLDPLTAPAPSEETGPGTHFRSSISTKEKSKSSSTRSSKTPSVHTYPTPPGSSSPTQSDFPPTNPFSSHRQDAFAGYDNGPSRKSSEGDKKGKGRRRNSSLGERFAGDMSHRPLDQLRKENKAANRAPHLRKKHIPGADIIDSLDKSVLGSPYHHEGPYDATLLARNTSWKHSPVAAVRESNNEALRATPREHIRDALDKHVPLQGTATIPPGQYGMDGKIMNYEEGADLMREPDAAGGAYKRWDHVKYLPEDYKGKGEPSFSLERALKSNDKEHRRIVSEGNSYEMQTQQNRPNNTRQRSASGNNTPLQGPQVADGDIRRSNSTGRRVGDGLKRRFGSLKRTFKPSDS